MRMIRCPGCNKLISELASHCLACSETMASPGRKSLHYLAKEQQANTSPDTEQPLYAGTFERPPAFKVPHFYSLDRSRNGTQSSRYNDTMHSTRVSLAQSVCNTNATAQSQDYISPGDNSGNNRLPDTDEMEQPVTWHKEVERPPAHLPMTIPPRPIHTGSVLLKSRRSHFAPAFTRFIWLYFVLLFLLIVGGIFGIAVIMTPLKEFF